MSPEYLAAIRANAGPVASNQPKARFVNGQYVLDQPKQRGKGGFLSSLISELGGAGGATGGAALGASIGSVVPGIGTLIGGIAGGAIGGFGGGFGGRAIENKVRDDEYRVGDSFKEGLLSGAFGGAGAAFQTARGLKAVGGLKGLGAATAAGGDDALVAASKQILKGGRKAGVALTNGGFDDLAKAAKLTAGRNVAERAGNSAYRSTLGVDDIVMPGKTKPTTLFKADELIKEARRTGLKGSPAQMQRQLEVAYGRFNTQVADELSKATKTVPYKKLYSRATREIADSLPLRIDGVPIRSELTRSLRQLNKLSDGRNLSATAVNTFKNGLDVDSAFRKLSGELASPMTAKETVDMALWRHADDWLRELAPGAKELTQRQSKLYGLAQGLGRMTRTPGDPKSVVDLAARVAGPTVRKAQNAFGRGLLATGGAEGAVQGLAPSFTRPVLKGAAARGVGNQMFNPSAPMEEVVDEASIQEPGFDATQVDTGFAPQQQPQQPTYTLQQALQDAHELLGGRATAPQYLSYAKALMDSQPETGGTLDAVAKRQVANVESAGRIVEQLKGLYDQAGGAQGFGGYLTKITSKTPLNSAQKSFSDQRGAYISRIVRALGEVGTLNEGDIQRAIALIPDYTDTPESAESKWNGLMQVLEGTRQSIYSNAGGLSEGNQLSNILSQYQETPTY